MRICVIFISFISTIASAIYTNKPYHLIARNNHISSQSCPIPQAVPEIRTNKVGKLLVRQDNEISEINHLQLRLFARTLPQRSPSPTSELKIEGQTTNSIQDAGRIPTPSRSQSNSDSTYDPPDLIGDLLLTNQHQRVKKARKQGFDAIRQAREHGEKADATQAALLAAIDQGDLQAARRLKKERKKLDSLEKQHIDQAMKHHGVAHAATSVRNKVKHAGWSYTQALPEPK